MAFVSFVTSRRPSVCVARQPIAALLALLLAFAAPAAANTRYDWRLRFRTVSTPHFDIYAHQGEAAMARRLGEIAERVRARLEPLFGVPRGRVRVILVDQTDLSNGFATPVPYDLIEISAVPPAGESLIGNTTDWLELVFTHEYTHILHLDRSRGLFNGLRSVFGRVPVVFPNAFLPKWQIEGLATFEESRMTGEGRLSAGDFRAIVDVAASRQQFLSMDAAAGGLDRWPSGNAQYAYGGYFHDYLADRFGAEKIDELADATAGRVPFFGTGAFRHVFGESVGTLWKDFRRTRESAARTYPTDARATRLTAHGYTVNAPRIAPNGTIYYATANAHGFPALMRVAPGRTPERVAWRFLGNSTAIGDDWVVYDRLERTRNVALFSDLYAVQLSTGRLRRLTREARAGDPDLSPDGRRIACTVQTVGGRAIAIMNFDPSAVAAPRVLSGGDDADYSHPRWSPDGRQLVAERRVRGRGFELVLLDAATGETRTLVSRRDARLVTPSWSRDGAFILFSADVGDAPFDIYLADVATGAVSRVTETAGGAEFPELSPDGASLVYVGYTPDGYDLFSVPFDRAAVAAVADFNGGARLGIPDSGLATRDSGPATQDLGPATKASELSAYNPWPSLLPSYWSPVVESDADEWLVGAATAMSDALGRHAYGVEAAWTSNRVRPDWNVAYAYDRWAPTLFASYSDDTDPLRGGAVRSRELTTGALLPFRRIRWVETLFGAFAADTDSFECDEPCTLPAAARRRSLRAGWMHDSRRAFGFSLGAEEGFQLETAVEATREALGSDADASATIVDLRGYHRLTRAHAMLAGRVAFAGSSGDARVSRRFSASGSGPAVAAFDFGRDTIGLLRGVASEDVVGLRAAVANLDLRIPLARPQRGIGNWPIFFRTIHAAAFTDIGKAWSGAFNARDLVTSVGGELSLDLVVGYGLPITLTSGAAWTRDPQRDLSQAAFFARIGRAF